MWEPQLKPLSLFVFLLHEARTVAKTFPSSDPTSDRLIPTGDVIDEQWQADVFHVGAEIW